MSILSLSDLARKIGEIDFTMLLTSTEDGWINGRPMSNNGDVEYDGDAFFFTYDDTAKIEEIEANPLVCNTYQGQPSPEGAPGIFVSVEGEAEIIRDKAEFAAHWYDDLNRWFPEGLETEGIALIKVRASRIRYWDGEDEGEIEVDEDDAE